MSRGNPWQRYLYCVGENSAHSSGSGGLNQRTWQRCARGCSCWLGAGLWACCAADALCLWLHGTARVVSNARRS
mgnify:CR=1 FL=1